MALVLMVVCALMLAIAALGVIALTTYWVAQRRRQIGMRRALGASWRDILAYFHTENLLIDLVTPTHSAEIYAREGGDGAWITRVA